MFDSIQPVMDCTIVMKSRGNKEPLHFFMSMTLTADRSSQRPVVHIRGRWVDLHTLGELLTACSLVLENVETPTHGRLEHGPPHAHLCVVVWSRARNRSPPRELIGREKLPLESISELAARPVLVSGGASSAQVWALALAFPWPARQHGMKHGGDM